MDLRIGECPANVHLHDILVCPSDDLLNEGNLEIIPSNHTMKDHIELLVEIGGSRAIEADRIPQEIDLVKIDMATLQSKFHVALVKGGRVG